MGELDEQLHILRSRYRMKKSAQANALLDAGPKPPSEANISIKKKSKSRDRLNTTQGPSKVVSPNFFNDYTPSPKKKN